MHVIAATVEHSSSRSARAGSRADHHLFEQPRFTDGSRPALLADLFRHPPRPSQTPPPRGSPVVAAPVTPPSSVASPEPSSLERNAATCNAAEPHSRPEQRRRAFDPEPDSRSRFVSPLDPNVKPQRAHPQVVPPFYRKLSRTRTAPVPELSRAYAQAEPISAFPAELPSFFGAT
ncbi:hypothetical protein E6C27_scaffold352G00470 [Cucumis melo var. makuwa]|uniref:Uncharacterized protein n=1 Tax=Cucumis melo var. makuwa TaxID=1194695 RepID=A0A5A7VRF7_CUCMM|nr:hypothetical protein E6C27_scaffold352G00470 [Cucumis melo var. makuwa]